MGCTYHLLSSIDIILSPFRHHWHNHCCFELVWRPQSLPRPASEILWSIVPLQTPWKSITWNKYWWKSCGNRGHYRKRPKGLAHFYLTLHVVTFFLPFISIFSLTVWKALWRTRLAVFWTKLSKNIALELNRLVWRPRIANFFSKYSFCSVQGVWMSHGKWYMPLSTQPSMVPKLSCKTVSNHIHIIHHPPYIPHPKFHTKETVRS